VSRTNRAVAVGKTAVCSAAASANVSATRVVQELPSVLVAMVYRPIRPFGDAAGRGR
jgi:hypothetical protein